jgi:RNA polymerase sigma factor (sigma-70 family)
LPGTANHAHEAIGEGTVVTAATGWEFDVHRRLIGGEQTALAECYDQFSSFVFGLAHRVIGDRRAAEDITQDVFLHLWERADAFDPARGGLRTWLGTLAHRRSVDYIRREEARRRRTERVGNEPSTTPDVEEMAVAIVTAERVRAALDELPPEQRAAIHLAYFGGKTYREVAAELKIPEGTAKSRMRLGLARVASVLEQEGVGQWA